MSPRFQGLSSTTFRAVPENTVSLLCSASASFATSRICKELHTSDQPRAIPFKRKCQRPTGQGLALVPSVSGFPLWGRVWKVVWRGWGARPVEAMLQCPYPHAAHGRAFTKIELPVWLMLCGYGLDLCMHILRVAAGVFRAPGFAFSVPEWRIIQPWNT